MALILILLEAAADGRTRVFGVEHVGPPRVFLGKASSDQIQSHSYFGVMDCMLETLSAAFSESQWYTL